MATFKQFWTHTNKSQLHAWRN